MNFHILKEIWENRQCTTARWLRTNEEYVSGPFAVYQCPYCRRLVPNAENFKFCPCCGELIQRESPQD